MTLNTNKDPIICPGSQEVPSLVARTIVRLLFAGKTKRCRFVSELLDNNKKYQSLFYSERGCCFSKCKENSSCAHILMETNTSLDDVTLCACVIKSNQKSQHLPNVKSTQDVRAWCTFPCVRTLYAHAVAKS